MQTLMEIGILIEYICATILAYMDFVAIYDISFRMSCGYVMIWTLFGMILLILLGLLISIIQLIYDTCVERKKIFPSEDR